MPRSRDPNTKTPSTSSLASANASSSRNRSSAFTRDRQLVEELAGLGDHVPRKLPPRLRRADHRQLAVVAALDQDPRAEDVEVRRDDVDAAEPAATRELADEARLADGRVRVRLEADHVHPGDATHPLLESRRAAARDDEQRRIALP